MSAIAIPFITGILGVLAGFGLKDLTTQKNDDNTKVFSGNDLIATIPNNILQAEQGALIELQKLNTPLKKVRIFVKRYTIGAGVTQKPTIPTDTIKNPFSFNSRLYIMTLRPDPTNGKVHMASEILINNDDLLYNNSSGDLTDSDAVNIAMPNEGLEFLTSKNISLFFWNDATGYSVTVYALIGVK